jgi:type II secretory pathway predicted ATPase ExeA
MYKEHFGFTASPFENNLDQRFLYLSRDHKEVLAALQYFIRENKAFAIICGDVGTGKTMLINCFLNNLPPLYHPIVITNPTVAFREILVYVAQTLGIKNTERATLDLIDEVRLALLEAQKHNESYFLIIDEAHVLDSQSLDDIRLVSNIETSDRKLLQILLVGQYELSYKLRNPKMRQLRQRLNVNRFLSSLDYEETKNYIDYRLQVVGSSFEACFQPECISLIYKLTNGVPREINRLCDSALLVCKGDGLNKVEKATLKKANRALRSDLIFTPSTPRPGLQRIFGSLPHVRPSLVGTAAIAILLLAGSLFLRNGTYFTPEPLSPATGTAEGIVTPDASKPDSSPSEATPQPAPPENTAEVAAETPVVSPAASTSAETTPPPIKDSAPITPPSPENSPTLAAEGAAPETSDEVLHTPTPLSTSSSSVPSSGPDHIADSGEPPQTTPSPTTEVASLPDQVPTPAATPMNTASPSESIITPKTSPISQDSVNQPAPQGALGLDSAGTPASEETRHPAGPMAPDVDTVTVKKGDTLTTIVSKRSPGHVISTIDALLEVNPFIKDRDLIFPGQVLLLPQSGKPSNSPSKTSTTNQPAFTIQVCTLSRSTRAVAEDYASYLQSKGYPTHIEKMRAQDGNTMYKICIGKYQTEGEAIEAAMYFQEKEGKPFIIMKSGPDREALGPEPAR